MPTPQVSSDSSTQRNVNWNNVQGHIKQLYQNFYQIRGNITDQNMVTNFERQLDVLCNDLGIKDYQSFHQAA